MTKSLVNSHRPGSAEYVVLHARWQRSRGRNASLPFLGEKNPIKALVLASAYAYFPQNGEYLSGIKLPYDYKCSKCGATGCKLWREFFNTYADDIDLYCVDCAAKDQNRDVSDMNSEGLRMDVLGETDQIGLLVPAVPTEAGDSFWGYTSVPQPGCDWWANLPNRATTKN